MGAAKKCFVACAVLLSVLALAPNTMIFLNEDFVWFTKQKDGPATAYAQWMEREQNRRQLEIEQAMQIIPTWMANYLSWHRERRMQPTNATKYLVVRCLEGEVCGGLSDRMKPLPFYVMLANLTQRVLLIHWKKPCELENFLSPPPNGLNWTLAGTPVTIDDVRNQRNFVNGHADSLSKEVRMLMGVLDGGNRAHLQSCKVLNVLLDGGQFIQEAYDLFNRWRAGPGQRGSIAGAYLGWNTNRTDVNDHDLFTDVFRIMFEPSPNVSIAIYQKMSQLDILNTEFNVAQVRAKHPKTIPDDVANEWYQQYNPGQVLAGDALTNMKWKIDKEEYLEFGPKMKEYFTRLYSNAIVCADNLAPGLDLPVYLASDSSFGNHMQNISSYPIRVAASGPKSIPLHIDSNNFQGRDPSDFYQLFVDMFVMARAKCMASNSGFGNLALRVSGSSCRMDHFGTVCPDSRNSTNGTLQQNESV